MKRLVLLPFILFLVSQTVHGQGTFAVEDLKPILNQEPELAKYIFSTLDLDTGGIASRVGTNVNEKLGGMRLGPYLIQAKPKGSGGPNIFELTVYTEQIFLDQKGKPTSLERASTVIEKFERLEVRMISKSP